VSDLARAHVLGLRHLNDQGDTIAVNLGEGLGVSVRQVIHAVRSATGCEITLRDAPRRPGDPSVLVADAKKKAREALGWTSERSDVATIIADPWRWYRKRFA
jgi:UDP-glucose 4-epimerase